MSEKGTVNSLQWAKPASETKPTVGLDELLQGLALLSSKEDRDVASSIGWNENTPPSVQSIKAGTMGLTRWWVKAVASFGGVSGLAALVTGFIKNLRSEAGDPVAVALIGGGALIIAAAFIAIALFVFGDLRARGQAAAARYTARGEVTAAFLAATAEMKATSTQQTAAVPDGMPEEFILRVGI